MKTRYDFLEMEMDAILKASKDNIVVTDGEGTVLRVSPNCESVYGKEASELIGKSVDELEAESIFSPSITKMVLKERKEMQVMQRTPAGRMVMATGLPVFDESGSIIRVISFSHDLTEIQHLKEDYEELQAQMERYQIEIQELREKDHDVDEFVIKSKATRQIWQLVQRVAKSDASVVFLGESGVGKNVFAHALHQGSQRKNESFIEVNCGAIPESLFESEMFGYEAGSFTGANKKGKAGLIELADKGTLFLDEIGELPLAVQAKLLKALQEKKITKVGGVQTKHIDFRLIASTNQNLEEMVKKGTFREDLFYRLNVIPITIPPLRERKEDILILAHYFLKQFNEKYETDTFFHAATVEELTSYSWPGNVRELQNMVERLVITADSRTIYPHALPFFIQHDSMKLTNGWTADELEETHTSLQEAVEEVEKRWLKRAFKRFKTTYEMAEYLGLSQSTVVRKLKKYNINAKTN
ncbi:sigma-54 interaction domain-containing protein [Priestia abyssalis]|uniref:sigma-54 interaction domain-containing protein n=1 Tax=Priestia abyssalis TaxID=1221450 RepID=UPI000995354C|nr:sigma 54-interacting transcriptional regulator [Priestia abyssalis]